MNSKIWIIVNYSNAIIITAAFPLLQHLLTALFKGVLELFCNLHNGVLKLSCLIVSKLNISEIFYYLDDRLFFNSCSHT